MDELDWDDLRLFAVLARAGSVRRAGEQLGIHASTVTRRLEHFERRLDARLFNRTPGGLRITEAGADMLERVEQVGRDIDDIERLVRGRDRRLAGRLLVSIPEPIGDTFLMPEIGGFSERFPDIEIEFAPATEHLDPGRREVDVAIEITERPAEHLVGRPLGRYALAVYAGREYLTRHDPFSAPQDCSWIEWETRHSTSGHVRPTFFPNVPVRARCRTAILQLAAVRAGLGLAVLPCVLGDPDDDLVRVPGLDPIPGPQIWALTHRDMRAVSRVHEFMSFLAETFNANAHRLRGEVEAG